MKLLYLLLLITLFNKSFSILQPSFLMWLQSLNLQALDDSNISLNPLIILFFGYSDISISRIPGESIIFLFPGNSYKEDIDVV